MAESEERRTRDRGLTSTGLSVDDSRAYIGESVSKRAFPLLAPGMPASALEGIELCSTVYKAFMRCLVMSQKEAACQLELSSYAACRFERDQQVRARTAEWIAKEGAKGAERRKELLGEIRTVAADTSLRFGFVDPSDPTYAKYRMQIQGELDDLASWMKILTGQS